MTTIYFVRHAENDHVAKGKLAGRLPGVHLNARGRAQAQELGRIFRSIRLQAVYSSPLERAMETALALASAQNLEAVALDGLLEVDVGAWQGLSIKALRRRKLWAAIQHTPSLVSFPGGESFSQAQARAVGAIEGLLARHGGRKAAVACVSHADIIKLAVAHFLGLPLDLFQRLVVEPASITALRFDSTVRLLTLNDTRASRVEEPRRKET